MTQNILINKFKGFGNFEIERLTRITLLGGRNNVGKTSILQTIYRQQRAIFIGSRSFSHAAEDAHRLGQLDIIGKKNSIVNFLKIIEPRLKSLSLLTMGDKSIIHGDIGLSRKIPVSTMGSGISKLLSIILSIATSKDGIVLIDEFENGIHYSAMPQIWKAIALEAREYNCQVLCTTHSYECIEAAHEGISGDLAGDFSYVRIDRNDEIYRSLYFNHGMVATAVKNNIEIR